MPLAFGRLCGLIFSLLLPFAAQAEKAPIEIVVAEFPPYLQLDAEGLPSGPAVELIELLLADIKQPYVIREFPPARAGQRLISGQAMLTIAPDGNPQLSRIALQGKEPLFILALNLYRKPETPAIHKLTDLAGKHVISVSAYSFGDTDALLALNQPPTRRLEANTHESALNMLLHGRADYLLDFADPIREQLVQLPPHSVVADPVAQVSLYWYLSRRFPDPQLLNQLDQTVSARSADGSIKRILLASQPTQ